MEKFSSKLARQLFRIMMDVGFDMCDNCMDRLVEAIEKTVREVHNKEKEEGE